MVEIGQPEHSVVTTCAYCGVGCNFKAEMRGDTVVRMVPWKDGKANHGHSCVKGRFAWGYANHQDRILKPMMREKITDPVARSAAGKRRSAASRRSSSASRRRPARTPSASSPRRAAPTKKTYLVQKLARAGVRQQQHRYLRAGLPLADRLWAEHDVRHLGRHAGFRLGRAGRRDHGDRRQSDRRPSGVRLAHEEAAAARARS